jgi:two-component system nitrogen regulation sensor histidine kinase GlnL
MGSGGLDFAASAGSAAVGQIAAAFPMPLVLVSAQLEILFVNPAAEQFFDMGAGLLVRHRLSDIAPFASPLIQIIGQALERGASVGEHDVDLTTPKHGERIADVIATPLLQPDGAVLVTLQERSFAQRLDR